MIKNRQLQRSSSKMTQSQTSLMNQSMTQANSLRKQSSLIYLEDQDDNVTSKLMKKISQKQSRQSVDDINRLIPINTEIQNVYNSFEDNFRVVKESNRVIFDVPQPKKQEFVKKEQFSMLKPSDGLQFCDLSSEKLNRLQINRLKFFYFRTKLKNKLSPLQIYFNFPDQIQNQVYRVFLSTTVEFPTKFNCEQTTSSRSIKIKTKSGTKLFIEDYLYFTLYSETDFLMTIHLVFGEFHCSFFVQKSQEHFNYFKYWEDNNKKSISPKRDKIIQNMDQTKYKSQNKLKEFLKVSENSAKKIISVVKRGKFLERERQLERTIKLAVKSQIIEFRKVEKSILITKCEKLHNGQQWTKIVKLINISEEIFQILHKKKRELRIKAKAKLMVWQLKIKLIMEVQQYGQNPLDRGHNKSMILLKMLAHHVSKTAKNRAQKIVTNFLKKTLLFQTALIAHQKMAGKVKVILRLFKTKKFQKKAFRDRFWRLIKNYLSSNKFSTTFLTSGQLKTIQIEKPVMAKIMDQYLDTRRQQWVFKIREYREKLKNDPEAKIEEYKIYKLPNENELKLIIKEYYFMKKNF